MMRRCSAGIRSGSGEEDGGPIVGTLMVSDDADGMTAPNFRIETGDGPSNGAASINSATGQWSYAPNADFNGADHFTVSVTDDDGNVETQVVDIAVSPVADPPVAHDDEFTATEDSGGSGNVLANDFNPDNETVVALSGVRDADSLPRIVITEIMANPATHIRRRRRMVRGLQCRRRACRFERLDHSGRRQLDPGRQPDPAIGRPGRLLCLRGEFRLRLPRQLHDRSPWPGQ